MMAKTPKKTAKPARKIDLKSICAAMDAKDRGFYDRLDDEQKKEFSGYPTIRYTSSVTGDATLTDYYLRSTNAHANINLFSVGKEHKKLQWLLLTTVAPYKLTPRYHEWIKGPVNTKSNTKKINALLQIYPTAKLTDLETMLAVISDAAFNALLDEYDISIK